MGLSEAIIRVVFGKRGSGKSTKAKRLIDDCAYSDRVCMYDTQGHDFTDGVVCYTLAELKSWWLTINRGPWRIIYRPEDPQQDFAEVCNLVYLAGDCVFVVEEVDSFFKGNGDTSQEFKRLIMRGRHRNVDMICVTQRPKGFGRQLTAQAEQFYLFGTREPDDLDYLRARCGELVADRVQGLAKYQYIIHDDTTDNYLEQGQDPLPVHQDDPPALAG